MSTGAGIAAAARRLGSLHEHPAVIAGWLAWTRPLLSRLTPGRRRALLALAALYVVVRRPLRDMVTAVDPRAVPPVAVAVIVLCFATVVTVYAAARHFRSLPAPVQTHPVITLHGLFWALAALVWISSWLGAGAAALVLAGLMLALQFQLWRLGYLLMSGQRGHVAKTRFSDHLIYLYPAYGGTTTPYGKDLDYLARCEARTDEALARSQLAGLKLLFLAWTYDHLENVIMRLVHSEPASSVYAAYGLGLPRLESLVPMGGEAPWLAAWAAVYVGLITTVLDLAARGHEIIGVLRLCGFYAFRNTYKPLLAPSLVEFWNRYFYYFKELLVDFFFFPVYVRYFRRSPRLRMFAATLAAAGLGNLYYHVIQYDPFMLSGNLTKLAPYVASRASYCLVLALGIYVSMRREQRRRGAVAGPASWAVQLRRIAGVWTFFALLRVLDAGTAPLAQRADFLLGLLGLR